MAIANAKLDAISQFIVDEENDGELNGDDIDEEIEHRTEGWVKDQNIENAIEVSDDCRCFSIPLNLSFLTIHHDLSPRQSKSS